MKDKEILNSNEDYAIKENISPAVIKRLPRYFRYLRILMREGKTRISSAELSKRMNITASQIRQDLNCFGGFGQQGYGYNVSYLYARICELLGVGAGLQAVIIGAGNLGRALAKNEMFEKRGVDVVAIFDNNPELVGQKVNEIPIIHIDEFERYAATHTIDMAVLTLPKEYALEMAQRIADTDISGIWNFTSQELDSVEGDIIVENVHLGDSLMTLNYLIANKDK
ncbi:MAG: redox-sensing transcriptional repressor Rex [Clostridia bacterium]|nr:redox-sensing transcriptional repressor Rex [Clostridia bacterium]